MSKKLKSDITSEEAQKLVDDVLNDKYAIQSKGKEMLDLIDKSKLNKKELKELEDTYKYVEERNKQVQSMVFNEQVKSDGNVDKYGVPTSVSFQKSIEKFEALARAKVSLKTSLLKLCEQENIPQEQAEQLVAGTTEKVAGESWDIISKMSEMFGRKFGDAIQRIIRDNETISKDSVVRKGGRPKGSKSKIESRNRRCKKHYEYLMTEKGFNAKKSKKICMKKYEIESDELFNTILYRKP